MILRLYQKQAADATFKEWEEHQSTLVVMPTATGKSLVMTELVRRMQPKRAIILVHFKELAEQTVEHLRAVGLQAELELADKKASTSLFSKSPVIVAGVQTMIAGKEAKRMLRFKPEEFGLLIIDEAHRYVSKQWMAVVNHFKSNPNLNVAGFTATPDRLDGKALGKIFDSTAYQYRMTQSIQDGWLVPVEQDIVTVGELDFSKVHASGADLNEHDLAAVMEDEKPLIKMVEASLRIIGSKKFIGFTASVRHAQMCADIFNRPRPNLPTWKPNMAACISGETPTNERMLILKDFKSGRLQGLLNVGVFVEGFNVPDAEVVLMAKPTLSRARYTQMVGRVLRPLTGILENLHSSYERKEAIAASNKPVAKVIDFVGNSGRHKLIHCQDVLGGDYSDEVIARAKQMAAESDGPMRVSETLEKSEEEIRAKMEAQRLANQARKAKITASDVTFTTRRIDPFDILDIKPVREQGWDKGKIISEKMANVLVKMGVADPYKLPYGQARQLLNTQFSRWQKHLATLKQVEILKKRGIDAKQMTMKEASAKIDEIAAREGWKKKEAA